VVFGGLLAVLVIVVAAVLLTSGGSDDDTTKSAARGPVAKSTENPKVPSREVTMDFRQLKRGLKGKAAITVKLLKGSSAHMTITASVPNAQYEVSLVKARGSSKRLLLGRDGGATYDNDVNLAALARRYVSIEVLALRLPHRPGHGRVRSLRVDTLQLTERLLHSDG
jgi:hypothetical protein